MDISLKLALSYAAFFLAWALFLGGLAIDRCRNTVS